MITAIVISFLFGTIIGGLICLIMVMVVKCRFSECNPLTQFILAVVMFLMAKASLETLVGSFSYKYNKIYVLSTLFLPFLAGMITMAVLVAITKDKLNNNK